MKNSFNFRPLVKEKLDLEKEAMARIRQAQLDVGLTLGFVVSSATK